MNEKNGNEKVETENFTQKKSRNLWDFLSICPMRIVKNAKMAETKKRQQQRKFYYVFARTPMSAP